MSLLGKFKNLFKSSSGSQEIKRPPAFFYVTRDVDPSEYWEIVGKLGDGAFGVVEKAKHKEKEIFAAAKAIELSAEEDLDSFLVEIEILKECPHKNVVGLHEAYYVNNKLWIFLEFCGGGALDSIMIELEKPLTEAQIRYVCHEMCEGLRFLHSRFVIHRDLKAGNVLLTVDGQVKLADFGVSAKNKSELQKRDSFIGTPYWMAPEVMMCETFKDEPYDTRADIWSLGITLIELAQRDPPYSEMSPNRVIIKIQKSEPPTLDQQERWSPDFRDFLRKCLVKRPDERWTATDLIGHPFCRVASDPKPILELLSEMRAEIIEEPVDDFEEDRRSRDSLDSEMTPERESLGGSQTESEFADTSNEGAKFHKEANSVSEVSLESKAEEFSPAIPAQAKEEDKTNDNVFDQSDAGHRASTSGEHEFPSHFVCRGLEEKNGAVNEHKNQSPAAEEESPTLAARTILDGLVEMLNNEENKNDELNHVDNENVEACSFGAEAHVDKVDSLEEIRRPSAGIERIDEEPELSSNDRSPSINTTVQDLITHVELQVARSYDLWSSFQKSIDDEEEKMHNRSNDSDVFHVNIPEDSAKENSNNIEELHEHQASPRVSGLKAMFEHQTSDSGVPPKEIINTGGAKVERHPSVVSTALKQKFENAATEAQKSKSSSRESFDIPEGVVRRSRNGVLRQGSNETAAATESAEHGRTASVPEPDGSQRKSVTELKAEFELSRQHSDSSVVKRESFNSTSSDSPGVHRKRRSMPPSTAFAERANAVSAIFENKSPKNVELEENRVGESVRRHSRSSDNEVNRMEKLDERNGVAENKERSKSDASQSSSGSVHVVLVKHEEEPPPDPPVDYDVVSPNLRVGDNKTNGTSEFRKPTSPPTDYSLDQSSMARNSITSLTSSNMTDSAIVVRRSKDRETDGKNASADNNVHKKMTKKTRVYVVDGVQVTSTTYHMMAEDGSRHYKAKEDFNLRKAELQELRRLQKEEAKQFQSLAVKTQLAREQQERKFDEDMQTCVRQFDYDVELMVKSHKKQLEEAERIQEEDLRLTSKKLKQDQEKEYKGFKESLKQEQKLLKQEVDMMPKNDRKEMFKRRKDALDLDQIEREKQFIEVQQRDHEATMRRLEESHRQKIALLEKQFLQQKHQLLRGKEAAIWELEKKQLHEKNQMVKNQIKDIFFLQRNQMLNRHHRELEHVRKLNARKEDEMNRAQIAERKRLPKILKSETKTRTLMFRESLKIRNDASDLSRKVREFEDQEQKRIQREVKRQEQRHKKRLEALKSENESALSELQQMQNEKRKMLVEHETLKLKQHDEEYASDLRNWHAQLKPRKQTLEDQFAQELLEQEQFYHVSTNGDICTSSSSGHITSLLIGATNGGLHN